MKKYFTPEFFIGLFVLSFTPFLLHQYFVSGLYKWHIAQTGNHISIIYVFSIFAIAYFIQSRTVQLSVFICFILLYSALTGTIGSLLIVSYYLLGIYSFGIQYHKSELGAQLSYGLVTFLLLRSFLSIISINLFFKEVVFVTAIAVTLYFANKSKRLFIQDSIKSIMRNDSIVIWFVVISLITVGLNIAQVKYDHDSLWYPLRSYILYFSNNFFADNGFYGVVHFYPKLWESLLNNIFTEYNYSYALSLCSALYIVLAVIIYNLFDSNKTLNTLIVLTLPVIVGLSFSLKTDSLLLLVTLTAFYNFEKENYDLAFSTILLSFCVKNSAYLFFIPIFVYFCIQNKLKLISLKKMFANNCNYLIVLLSFMICSLFLFRTYLLSGVFIAFPAILISVQEFFGLKFNMPLYPDHLEPINYMKIFDIYKIIFIPESLSHHRFFYNGYLWALSLLVIDISIAIFFPVVIFIGFYAKGIGDGNYFAPMTVLLTILILRKVELKRGIAFMIIMSNIAIAVVANPNWAIPKIPSVKNMSQTIFCSDERHLSKIAHSCNMTGLKNTINDQTKKYFIFSNDRQEMVWLLCHRFNVTHITEFRYWHRFGKYNCKEYLNEFIDILIIEKNFEINVNISEFEKFKSDETYTYFRKKTNEPSIQ